MDWGQLRETKIPEPLKGVSTKEENCLGGFEKKEKAKNNGMKWNRILDIRKNIVIVQTVENSIPREVVQTSWVESLKTKLDKAVQTVQQDDLIYYWERG